MSLIYSKAETVEIWLGPSTDGGELALAALGGGRIDETAPPALVYALTALVQREWFERVWIIQELVLAAPGAAFVNCGSLRITWDSFAAGFYHIREDLLDLGAVLGRRLTADSNAVEPQDPSAQVSLLDFAQLWSQLFVAMVEQGGKVARLGNIRATRPDRAAGPALEVGAALRLARYAQATDKKDKVFGLCGLFAGSAVRQLIKSFDKTTEEVYFAATLYILQNDVHPNIYHEFPTLPPSKAGVKVPSWTLDFQFTGVAYTEIALRSLTKTSASRSERDKLRFSSDGSEMTTDACVVDSIKAILNPTQVVQLPNTEEGWQQVLLRYFREGSVAPPDPLVVSRRDKFFFTTILQKINLITFLEEAQKLHEQAALAWEGPDSIPSFWTVVLAGFDPDVTKWKGGEILTGASLESEIDILLGRRDEDLQEADVMTVSKATAIAFGLDVGRAVAVERSAAAANLYNAVERVL